jgi:hypothetical protein
MGTKAAHLSSVQTGAKFDNGVFETSWRDVEAARGLLPLGPGALLARLRPHELAHNGVRDAVQLTVAELAGQLMGGIAFSEPARHLRGWRPD